MLWKSKGIAMNKNARKSERKLRSSINKKNKHKNWKFSRCQINLGRRRLNW